MRNSFVRFFFLVLIAFASNLIIANTVSADPSTPEGPDGNYDPEGVPLDGGAGLLVAAGVAYGLKKIHDKRKEKSSQDHSNS